MDFRARLDYETLSDTTKGKRHERAARMSWQKACDLGLHGQLPGWEELLGAAPSRLAACYSVDCRMWEKSKGLARAFKLELSVYRHVLGDERTPRAAKIFLGLAVGYLCMPFDLIPDFIPVIGHLDDAIIVPGLVYIALSFVPTELISEHREKVRASHSLTRQPDENNCRALHSSSRFARAGSGSDQVVRRATKVSDITIARWLEYLTLGWNLLEAGVSVVVGLMAGSIALIGFGADSLIESASSVILLWRLQGHEVGQRREALALKLVGVSFIILALYISIDAGTSLAAGEGAEASIAGIVIAALSLIVMPLLARAKRNVAQRMNSKALAADSRQTQICAYLSAILLIGLALNQWLGWWWSDAVVALLMLPVIMAEGIRALKGKTCC